MTTTVEQIADILEQATTTAPNIPAKRTNFIGDECDLFPDALMSLVLAYGNAREGVITSYIAEQQGRTPARPSARHLADAGELRERIRDLCGQIYTYTLDYGDECAEYGMPGADDLPHATRSNGVYLRRMIRDLLGAKPAPELEGDDTEQWYVDREGGQR